MAEKSLDERLVEFEIKHKNNWQHLIFNLRKHMDYWNVKHVKNPSGQLKHSYLPILFNIGVNGTTATRIGRRSMLIKQNLSRTIKELEGKGMVVARKNNDKRSDRLDLTTEAKEIVLAGHMELEQLQDSYKKIVGEDDWMIATNVLLKIIAYHESLIKSNHDNQEAV